MGPVSALSPHTHSQANTQKARVIMERNSPVISLFPLDSEQSASEGLCQRNSGSFIRREIKSSSTATGCWKYFIFGRENKSKEKNPSFEANKIV